MRYSRLRLSKNLLKSYETDQRGVCAGGKKPPARSIKKRFSNFRRKFENRLSGAKILF